MLYVRIPNPTTQLRTNEKEILLSNSVGEEGNPRREMEGMTTKEKDRSTGKFFIKKIGTGVLFRHYAKYPKPSKLGLTFYPLKLFKFIALFHAT